MTEYTATTEIHHQAAIKIAAIARMQSATPGDCAAIMAMAEEYLCELMLPDATSDIAIARDKFDRIRRELRPQLTQKLRVQAAGLVAELVHESAELLKEFGLSTDVAKAEEVKPQ